MPIKDLTEKEKKLWLFMVRSEMENGMIIVPPDLAKECNDVLKKLRGEKENE